MSGESFDGGWLALREPVDHRSRAHALSAELAEWWKGRGASRVVDLGCGTGSNLRYLAPRLPEGQRWVMVDSDAAHLSSPASRKAEQLPAVAEVKRVLGDLGREGLTAVAGSDLATASALLDLVSEAWIRELARVCARAGCAALLALSWDGSVTWRADGEARLASDSTEADDALVLAAVRSHQRRDKGLGPALGPDAPSVAERAFRAAGFRTRLSASPWRLERADRRLASALVAGWATAATEQEPVHAARIATWAKRRQSELANGEVTLEVGHLDLLALPDSRP